MVVLLSHVRQWDATVAPTPTMPCMVMRLIRRPRGRPRGGGNPDLVASKEEVLAFFDERIRHYQQLKEMYLNNELNAWRRRGGSLTFEKR